MELSNAAPGWVNDAFTRGYKEALLDVYCFLTANGQIMDYPERLTMIENMIGQVNKQSNKLTEVG
jgi:septation ring formation regulator EzrA